MEMKKKSSYFESPLFLLFITLVLIYPFFSSCAKAGENPKDRPAPVQEAPRSIQEERVREPAVSGQFYPASPGRLREMLARFLDPLPSRKDPGRLIALICPHAGYIYSGEVAARSYKLLDGSRIDTVILIGPSHRFPLRGASVWPSGIYKTPLGDVEINRQMATQITESSEDITFEPQAHLQEHSLEVQIPFLQMVLKTFRIVPVLVGRLSPQTLESMSRKLASLLEDSRTILVASTDLSHYHPYEEAVAMDKRTLEAIRAGHGEQLMTLVKNGDAELCGLMPVLLLLRTMQSFNQTVRIDLLKYANSGDTSGMKDRVVGYAALSFSISDQKPSDSEERGERKLSEEEDRLNEKEQKKLLQIARSSITSYLDKKGAPQFEVTENRLLERRGVFVTLHKKGMLRGCIGYIKPIMPLYKATSDCAISAAVKDYRFPPLKEQEMDEIDIEISALTPLKKIESIDEIKIGEHGLYISRPPYSGLLLPQVATEYGWDKMTFLTQTCRKAGLPEDAWKKGAEIYIFSAQIFGEKEG